VIVADASAVVELVLGTPLGEQMAHRISRPDTTLHAPHVLRLEAVHAIRRAEAVGDASARRAGQAVEDLAALQVHRYAHESFLQRIWELRANLTAYDASYVALAEALDVPLVTCDGRLARAPGHRAEVELLST
jgi:predicted nucleic acid-binding protein